MEVLKCTLCFQNFFPATSEFAKHPLQVIFLLKNILEMPQDKCWNFLQDYGDPCSRVHCCDSCSFIAGKCRIIFNQIIKLQKEFDESKEEIRDIIIRSVDYEDQLEGSVLRSFITKGFRNEDVISESIREIYQVLAEDISNSSTDTNEMVDGLTFFPVNSINLDIDVQSPSMAMTENDYPYQINELLNQTEYSHSEQQNSLSVDVTGSEKVNNSDINETPSSSVLTGGQCTPEEQDSETILDTSLSHAIEQSGEDLVPPPPSNSLISTSKQQLKCTICSRRFTKAISLKAHERAHKGEEPYKCKFCQKGFTKWETLNHHEKNHTGGYKCTFCNECFVRSNSLEEHLKEYHNEMHEFLCHICGEGHVSITFLQHHISTHTRERPYKCKVCEISYTTESHLQRHETNHIPKQKIFKCEFCRKRFAIPSRLKEHEATHFGVEPFKCHVCNKEFSKAQHYNNHFKCHPGVKQHRCKICDKSFASSRNLKKHARTHTGGKPFKCIFCGTSFAGISGRHKHELVHTKEWPASEVVETTYYCNVCDKNFASTDRDKHLHQMKKGDRPHKCTICGRRFRRLEYLNKHERVTHPKEIPLIVID